MVKVINKEYRDESQKEINHVVVDEKMYRIAKPIPQFTILFCFLECSLVAWAVTIGRAVRPRKKTVEVVQVWNLRVAIGNIF